MTTPAFPGTNFLDFLEQEPRAAFFSDPGFLQQRQKSPRRKRFFENQFSNIHNQFLGALGAQIRGGETPTGRFTDFLGGFDFEREYAGMPPSLRGDFTMSLLNPKTRFLPF